MEMAKKTNQHQTQRIIADFNRDYAGLPEKEYDSSHDPTAQKESMKGVKRVQHEYSGGEKKEKSINDKFDDKKGQDGEGDDAN